MSSGCHRLLREGAGLVESPAELLELLYGCSPSTSRVPPESNSRSRIECALEGETLGTDELAQRLDLSVREILIRIVDLELRGLVTRAPGGLYRLT
jgi:DNA processing protein